MIYCRFVKVDVFFLLVDNGGCVIVVNFSFGYVFLFFGLILQVWSVRSCNGVFFCDDCFFGIFFDFVMVVEDVYYKVGRFCEVEVELVVFFKVMVMCKGLLVVVQNGFVCGFYFLFVFIWFFQCYGFVFSD